MLSEYGFTLTINKYTRVLSKTCTDHAFTKVKNQNLKFNLINLSVQYSFIF